MSHITRTLTHPPKTTPPTPTALTALRNVAEDCVDADFNARLPTQRRTEILKQLNAELPDVLPRLFQVMARTYEGECYVCVRTSVVFGGWVCLISRSIGTLRVCVRPRPKGTD